jgi:hypothetical protein
MLEPARPVLGLRKIHSREFFTLVHSQPVAGFLQHNGHFSVSAKFEQPSIDVGHEGIALRIDHDTRAGMSQAQCRGAELHSNREDNCHMNFHGAILTLFKSQLVSKS